MTLRSCQSLLVMAWLLAAAIPAAGDDQLVEQFKSEAPRGWQAIEAVTSHVEGRVVDTQDEQIVNRPRRVFEAEYFSQALGRCVLVRVDSDKINDEPNGQRVLCATQRVLSASAGPIPRLPGG